MFTVLQKNTRSSSLFSEVQGCKWNAILVSETWRPKPEEVWESDQGHIVMGVGKYENKHGVAIIVNKEWKHRIGQGASASASLQNLLPSASSRSLFSASTCHTVVMLIITSKRCKIRSKAFPEMTMARKSSEVISTLNWDLVLVSNKQVLDKTLSKKRITEKNG